MSDGYRDDGTGTEDWGVTSIADQIAAWSERRNGLDFYADRLRTTAEALREVMTWAAPMSEAPRSSRPAWFDSARAILARLKQEGLT